MSKMMAHWVLTVLLLLAAVALFLFLPGIWGFIALGLAAALVPIPGWQELLSKTIDIRTVAVMALTVLTVVMSAAAVADALQPPEAEPSLESQAPAAEPSTAPTVTEPQPMALTETDPEPTPVVTTAPPTNPASEPVPLPVVTTEPQTQPTPQPAPPATEPVTQADCDYVLNTKTKKFHDPDCGSVGQMKEENRGSHTGSREDLLADGYTPCGRCKP